MFKSGRSPCVPILGRPDTAGHFDNDELQGTKSDVKSCHWNCGETEGFPDESGNGSSELRLLEMETKSD